MESTKQYFLVKFGDSRVYRVEYDGKEIDGKHDDSPLVRVEKELNDYLRKEFPGDTFAYFTTPKVTEISPEHEAKVREYPELDARAVNDIKHILRTEVETMEAVRRDNDNAPFSKMN